MARLGLAHLLVVVVAGVIGASGAVEEDFEFPSLDTALGSKILFADDYYDDGDDGRSQEVPPPPPPKPCCFPAIWQGRAVHNVIVGAHGRERRGKSGPMMSRAVDQFYVDGAHSRLAGDKIEFHGHRLSVNFSWIFSVGPNRTGDLYVFDKKAQKCQHRSLRNAVFRRQCIPANASYHGSHYLGPAGGLGVQSWSFGQRRCAADIDGDRRPHPKPKVAFGAGVLVVPTTCIPVLLQEHGFFFRGIDEQQNDYTKDTGDSHYESYIRRMLTRTTTARPELDVDRGHRGRGVFFSSSAYFSNVYTRIADPSVFVVPSYCKKGDASTVHYGDELPTILERFIVL